jgi:chromosome partitioning protein
MIISIANQKGGVGKTTTAQCFAAGLLAKKKSVLIIDLDPQSNFSTTFGIPTENNTVYEVMKGEVDINESIRSTDSGDLIPSNLLLAGADIEFYQLMKREELLKKALKKMKKKYDYIIIDTPPALGILTINAFTASNKVIIPSGPDSFSIDGIYQLYNTIKQVKKHCNSKLAIAGILVTKYKARLALTKVLLPRMEKIAEKINTKLYSTYIRESISIQEAQAEGTNVIKYSPSANAQVDYINFVNEFLGDI